MDMARQISNVTLDKKVPDSELQNALKMVKDSGRKDIDKATRNQHQKRLQDLATQRDEAVEMTIKYAREYATNPDSNDFLSMQEQMAICARLQKEIEVIKMQYSEEEKK